jgi:hypothetical protein
MACSSCGFTTEPAACLQNQKSGVRVLPARVEPNLGVGNGRATAEKVSRDLRAKLPLASVIIA